jgi:hypothetical protein
MAIKKIYTYNNLEMELVWSEKGVHLIIDDKDDMQFGLEFILEPNDIDDFVQDINGLDNARIKDIEKTKSN